MRLLALWIALIVSTARAQMPAPDVQVTEEGIRFLNYEVVHLLEIPRDEPFLLQGTSVFSDSMWTSDCLDWQNPTCYESVIELGLFCQSYYSFRMLTEAQNRMEPMRDEHLIEPWRFRPGDINMDGTANMHDVIYYNDNAYDWNLDGLVDSLDIMDLIQEIASGRCDPRIRILDVESIRAAPLPFPGP